MEGEKYPSDNWGFHSIMPSLNTTNALKRLAHTNGGAYACYQ